MATQSERAERFAALHAQDRLVLLPNPWSGGAARLLQALGFQALATTGAGAAFSSGAADRRLPATAVLANLAEICRATSLPVTADMQDGFGDTPEAAARAVLRAAEAGAVGCSIEDATSGPVKRIYPFSLSVERIHAASEAAATLPFPFVLTARADNFFEGIADLDDTIARLQAYEEAGAKALYAPGLCTVKEVRQVLASISSPLNVLLHRAAEFDVPTLKQLGVRRVSVGAYLARVALDAMHRAAMDLQAVGRLTVVPRMSGADLNSLFEQAP